jgi:hypothetical protein
MCELQPLLALLSHLRLCPPCIINIRAAHRNLSFEAAPHVRPHMLAVIVQMRSVCTRQTLHNRSRYSYRAEHATARAFQPRRSKPIHICDAIHIISLPSNLPLDQSSDVTWLDSARLDALRRDVPGSHRRTHKSLNGNNFATPPRTINTATAKLTIRLCFPLASQPIQSFCLSSQTHKMSEKSMAGELARCGNRSLATLEMRRGWEEIIRCCMRWELGMCVCGCCASKRCERGPRKVGGARGLKRHGWFDWCVGKGSLARVGGSTCWRRTQ